MKNKKSASYNLRLLHKNAVEEAKMRQQIGICGANSNSYISPRCGEVIFALRQVIYLSSGQMLYFRRFASKVKELRCDPIPAGA